MSYGALIVGYEINLNDSKDLETRELFCEALDACTNDTLWLAGGHYENWRPRGQRWTSAFVCKTISYIDAEHEIDDVQELESEDIHNIHLWLRQGLPYIEPIKALITKDFPNLRLASRPYLYMVLHDTYATVSSELMFGSSGTLEWCNQQGWTVSLPCDPQKARDIATILNTSKYNLFGKNSFAQIDIKSEIMEQSWFTVVDFYNDNLSSWDLILGDTVGETFLYKDTHLIIQPSLFNRKGGSWFHRVWQSG